jgi:hypothetical protein
MLNGAGMVRMGETAMPEGELQPKMPNTMKKGKQFRGFCFLFMIYILISFMIIDLFASVLIKFRKYAIRQKKRRE